VWGRRGAPIFLVVVLKVLLSMIFVHSDNNKKPLNGDYNKSGASNGSTLSAVKVTVNFYLHSYGFTKW